MYVFVTTLTDFMTMYLNVSCIVVYHGINLAITTDYNTRVIVCLMYKLFNAIVLVLRHKYTNRKKVTNFIRLYRVTKDILLKVKKKNKLKLGNLLLFELP